MQNNTTHFLSEFISNNTETFREILPHKAPFVRVHIKQYWHFRRAATKQYFTNFSEFIWHNTISGSYYKMILHIFSEFISNNIDTSIVTTKNYSKIILFCKFSSNENEIFRELRPNATDFFPQRMHQTVLLSLSNVN